jgi:hypothetical protein
MATSSERWHRQPIVWLGATILLACIVGCISMVVLAGRYPDEPLSVSSDQDQVLKMPAARAPEPTQ